MPMGPVEYIMVTFPDNEFDGTILPALSDIVRQGLVHIIDLVFITKDAEGRVRALEFDDVPGGAVTVTDLEGEAGGLLSEDDIQWAAEELAPDSSAALLVWEDLWAAPFAQALRRNGAELIAGGRIPADVVEAAMAAVES
jgi:Family of unknown function (DUF6325)